MSQQTGPTMVQMMTCHPIGAKPLPEPILANFQLDSKEPNLTIYYLKVQYFYSRELFAHYAYFNLSVLFCHNLNFHSQKNLI